MTLKPGLKIDPETAEVDWTYEQTFQNFGVLDDQELQKNFIKSGVSIGRVPKEANVWIHFSDLPEGIREAIWAKHRSRIAFPAGLEGMPRAGIEDADLPF